MKITGKQALHVWWSYMWRSAVLMLPVAAVLPFFMFLILGSEGFRNPQPDPANVFKYMWMFSLLWLGGMGLTIWAQVVAMKWTLNALGYSLSPKQPTDLK